MAAQDRLSEDGIIGHNMRIAIAHDYLTQLGGAERVVLSLTRAFPEAPVYTTLYEPDTTFPEFADVDVRVSPLNRIGYFRRNHRAALPLLAPAIRSMKIDADLVVASSSGWAHGVPTTGKKLVYCHSPARWLYLPDDYLGDEPVGRHAAALRVLGPRLRRWDRQAAAGADAYLANSHVVRDRIARVYGIDAPVVFPPHRVDPGVAQRAPEGFGPSDREGYYLLVSRLLPYKNVGTAIDAFRDLPDRRLVIVGRGPLAQELHAQASANVTFLEGVSDEELAWLYAGASALIAPSYEDFGLTVIEAASFGTPALALAAGGYLDTVVESETGYFFANADCERIRDAICTLEGRPLDRSAIRSHAEQFGEPAFIERLRRTVDDLRSRTRVDG